LFAGSRARAAAWSAWSRAEAQSAERPKSARAHQSLDSSRDPRVWSSPARPSSPLVRPMPAPWIHRECSPIPGEKVVWKAEKTDSREWKHRLSKLDPRVRVMSEAPISTRQSVSDLLKAVEPKPRRVKGEAAGPAVELASHRFTPSQAAALRAVGPEMVAQLADSFLRPLAFVVHRPWEALRVPALDLGCLLVDRVYSVMKYFFFICY